MINPKHYKGGKSRPLMFNIRLRKTRGPKPTAAEVVDVLETMLATQRVPAGWKFAQINWRDPRTASTGWRTGSLAETFAEEGLGRVIKAALGSARVSVVRTAAARPTLDPEADDFDGEDYDDGEGYDE